MTVATIALAAGLRDVNVPRRKHRPARIVAIRLLIVAAVGTAITIAVPTAATASTCTFDDPSDTVTAIGDGTSDELVVVMNRPVFNGDDCGAVLDVIDTISLVNVGLPGTLSIGLTGGPFEPGLTDEATGISEIELTASGWLTVLIVGDDDPEVFVAGSAGVNLNNDDDADLTFPQGIPDRLAMAGSGGDDLLSAEGDFGNTYGGVVTLLGGDGDDDLRGGSGPDRFDGGPGDDTFVTGGDPGSPSDAPTDVEVDTLSYEFASGPVTVDLAAGTSTGAAGGDTIEASMGAVIGSAFDDTLLGNAQPQRLDGGPGADLLDGRGGLDFALFASAPAAVAVDLEAGGASGHGTDALDRIEGILGSDHDDRVVAAGPTRFYGIGGHDTIDLSRSPAPLSFSLANEGAQATPLGDVTVVGVEGVIGSARADALFGSVGDDALAGGGGNDRLVGRLGDDRLLGGAGRDTADYASATSRVLVFLSIGAAGGAGSDVLEGIESVRGSPFADRLVGDGGANSLTGGAGADTIRGLGGPDTLIGQDGNDALSGGTGTDTCLGGAGADTLTSCERT